MDQPICQTMNKLAADTWAHLEMGSGSGYGQPDERALMDHHLLELSRHHEGIRVAKFDQVEETETGADFEWWIDDGSAAFGMRVQAKKLDLGRGTYRQLRHGGLEHAQVDQLISSAEAAGLAPAYLFFNGPTDARGPDRCPRAEAAADRGCTLARADDVKRALEGDAPTIETIGALSWPWQCLVCCPRHERAGASERALRLLERAGLLDNLTLWSEAPAYVRQLLRQDPGPASEDAEAGFGPPAESRPSPSASTVVAMAF